MTALSKSNLLLPHHSLFHYYDTVFIAHYHPKLLYLSLPTEKRQIQPRALSFLFTAYFQDLLQVNKIHFEG